MPIISVEKLNDANLDAETIEQVVNGEPNVLVESRRGRKIPTLATLGEKHFSAGVILYGEKTQEQVNDEVGYALTGLSFANKTYATVAAANEDIANIAVNQSVWVSSATEGGLYEKKTADAASLTKSAFDPLTQAKGYADEKTKNIDDFKDESKYAFSLSDKSGNVALGIKNDGTVAVDDIETNKLKVGGKDIAEIVGQVKKVGSYAYNVVHFEIFGQSLSQGAYSTPVLTTSQKQDSIMFSGGIRPQHPSYDVPNFFADFIPLIEKADISGYVGYETPCGGATEAVKQLIQNENGITFDKQKYQLLGTACGEGGMSIATLSTTYLNNNLKPAITNAFNLCQSKGLTYGMPLMGWVQGEEDNKPGSNVTIQQYKDRLQNLIGLVDAHLKTLDSNLALNGVITTQLCSFKTSGRAEPHIELAIYQAATASNTNVHLACPLYIFDYKDGYHIDGPSSKWMGAYIGLAHKRILVDGEDWKPVHPISHVKQGRILEVKFHVPVQPLVFDTSHIALNTNYGFSLVDGSNNAIAISSVVLTQGDTVKIIAATPIPTGAKLRYAWSPSTSPNRTTGPRGNMRDSQGDDLIFDPTGINKPMHNWTPIFEYEVI